MADRVDAPENCGFTSVGSGFVRVWLAGDDTSSAGRDLWLGTDHFYPLNVSAYQMVNDDEQHPVSLVFREDTELGGYTSSYAVDENTYDLFPNIGAYVIAGGEVRFKRRGEPKFRQVTLAQGDLYAGDVEAVELVEGSDVNYLVVVGS